MKKKKTLVEKFIENKLQVRIVATIVILLFFINSFLVVNYLWMPGRIYGLVFYGSLSTIGIIEIVSNTKIKKPFIAYYVVLGLVCFLLPLNEFFLAVINDFAKTDYFLLQLKTWWLYLALIPLVAIPFLFAKGSFKEMFKDYLLNLFAIILIPIFGKWLWTLNSIEHIGAFALIYIGLISGMTDSFALLGGMAFGRKFIKRGFAPKLSPNKTWEGAIIGFVLSLIATVIYGIFLVNKAPLIKEHNFIVFTILSAVLLPIASILGDLLFSKIKRIMKIKDFSKLIPGHGGLMDRFDSTFLVTYTLIILIIIFSII